MPTETRACGHRFRACGHRSLSPQTGHAGSLSTRTSRHSIASASSSNRRPASERPIPASSFSASAAWAAPIDADQRGEHTHRGAPRFLEFVAFAEQAVVTGTGGSTRVEYGKLTVEAYGGAGDQGLLCGDAGAIDRVARGEIIGTIDDYVGGARERRQLSVGDARAARLRRGLQD